MQDLVITTKSELQTLVIDAVNACLDYRLSTLPFGFNSEEDQILTIQQAAEMLSLSVPTVYGLVSKAEIPCSKRNKRLYFSKQELTDWVKAGRKKTQAEIQAEANAYLLSKKKRG